MPIHAMSMSDTSVTAKTKIAEQHSMHQHHKMMQSDQQQSEDHCPPNNDSCCLTLTIPLNQIDTVQLSVSDDVYPSPSFSPPKSILETLYKPPKFFA